MFEKLTHFMDTKLSTPMAKFSEQRHLRAIRDGIIATLPIVVVASMFMVIAFLPTTFEKMPEIANSGFIQFIKSNQGTILLPYRMSMFIMTLYAVFGIGYSLAKSYDLDGLSGAVLSELAFLLTIVPKVGAAVPKTLTETVAGNEALKTYIDGMPKGWLMPMPNLGSAGMFVGILAAFFAVEVYRFTQKSGFKISMPPQVPASVARSFEALTPTFIVLLSVSTLTMFYKVDVHSIIGKVVEPLVSGSDSLVSVIVIVLLTQFFWSFGIHGASIVFTLARPIWNVLLANNTEAFANGTAVAHTAAEPFYQWFVMIGGAGSTIGLAICLLFARSAYLKALGRTSIVPALFNINEPLIFGTPLVMNPSLMIPFILAPLANGVVAWIAFSTGLVNRVVALAPWTLPGPIGSYISTGGDFRGAILSLVLIGLSIVIYFPFFKMYDNQMLKEETTN